MTESTLSGRAKPRVLFVSQAVTLAHLARPLVLADALQKTEKYEVFLASAGDCRYEFCFEGVQVQRLAINTPTYEQFTNLLERGEPVFGTRTIAENVLEDLAIIDQVKPDLIVGDFRFSLAVSAPLRQVPHAVICNAYWSPYAGRRHFPVPDLGVTRWLGASLCQSVFNVLWPLVSRIHAGPLNRARGQYGLPKLDGLPNVFTQADHVLYADHPLLAPTHRPLPPCHHYLGNIVWSPAAALPTWWNELDTDKPSVYICLGSSGKTHLLPSIIDALAEIDANVLVATAGRAALSALPKNVFAADYLPGSQLAAKTNLTICNGGSPTVQQVLREGKPVLGIASNMDQFLAMEEVCRLGAGRLIRSIEANGQKVRENVLELLGNDRYLAAARKIRAEINTLDAAKNFCEFVEQLLD